jgi:hypothetical protein
VGQAVAEATVRSLMVGVPVLGLTLGVPGVKVGPAVVGATVVGALVIAETMAGEEEGHPGVTVGLSLQGHQ